MFGGLDGLSTYITTVDEALGRATVLNESMAFSNADTIDTTEVTTRKMSRCTIDTMKSWTTAYPPNTRPMCLHAAYLKLKHPVTEEICEWDAPAAF
jgi:hypothetical protein